MPGPAVHHLIADKLLDLAQSGKLDTPGSTVWQDLVKDPNNLHWLYLGAQGPDVLFFLFSDWEPALRRPLELIMEVMRFIDDVKKTINRIVPAEIVKMVRKVEDAVAAARDRSSVVRIIEETTADTKQLIDVLGKLVLDTGVKLVLDRVNPFEEFEHPYRDGICNQPKKWWYFDALHYRYTGKFARRLLESSSSLSGPERLYALGYLSHFAADIVGHPYVNILSGAPYRNASQRHKVAENFHDLLAYRDSKLGGYDDLNFSRLHESYRRPLDPSEAIPTERIDRSLFSFVSDNIKAVYSVDADGDGRSDFGPAKEIDPPVIESAIKLWRKWWESSTETGTLPLPESYDLTGELKGIYETARENVRDITGEVGDHLDNARGGGLWDIIKALLALAIGAILLAGAILDAIAATALTISTAAYRAALAVVYEHLFDAWQNLRLAIALKGLAYPLLEHQHHRHLRQFAHPKNSDSSGMSAVRHRDFLPLLAWPPKVQQADGKYGPKKRKESHLLYAPLHRSTDSTGKVVKHGELPLGTLVAPASYFEFDHQHYLPGTISSATTTLDKITTTLDKIMQVQDDHAGAPSGVAALRNVLSNGEATLGNAVDLTLALLSQHGNGKRIPDFNLDADRGYGFLCWFQEEDVSKPNTPTRIVTKPEDGSDGSLDKARTSSVDLRWIGSGGGNA